MKIWKGYGSEHSANLVMIGHFKDAQDAELVKELLDQLTQQVMQYTNGGEMDQLRLDRYPKELLDFLMKANLASLRPEELEQVLYDVHIDIEENDVVITTDEIDISAYLKVLIDKGAKVEVYSAHYYPDTEHGR